MTPVYTAEGVADFKAGRWRGTVVRERFPNGEGDEEAFGIDEFAYRRPAKGGEWKRLDLVFGEIGSPFPGVPVIGTGSSDGRAPAYALDPDARRRIFDAAILDIDSGDVTEMHGAEVRHYRVHMAGEEEIRTKLPKPLGDEVAAWDQYGALKDLNLWVDGESRLVAYEYRPDDDSLATVKEEWWDFGEAPEVPIPEGLDENGSGTSRFQVTARIEKPGEDEVVDEVDIARGDKGFYLSVMNVGGITVRTSIDDGPQSLEHSLQVRDVASDTLPQDIPWFKRGAAGPSFVYGSQKRTRFEPKTEPLTPPCTGPESGNLHLKEFQTDGSRVLRLNLEFQMTCPTEAGKKSVEGRLLYRSLVD